jgi:ornithine carbamoyltransferase
VKDLLRTEHLSRKDVELLLNTAAEFAEKPLKASEFLKNKSVAIYMTKPSTRTRLASETAVAHLGGHPIFLRSEDLQLGRGETIEDTAKIISGYADALIVRTFDQSDVDQLGRFATIPVINGLTDSDHPTQLLADWTTIQERFGASALNRKFVYFGDGNNVANAWLIMGAIMGVDVVVASPESLLPDPEVVKKAEQIATKSGAKIEVTSDAKAAAQGASVFYTDVWMSMGDDEGKRAEKFRALSPYKITSELMALGEKDAVFMHCLPAHRGEEVSADVIDGDRSLVFREAFHRRTTIQALLFHLISGDLTGDNLKMS